VAGPGDAPDVSPPRALLPGTALALALGLAAPGPAGAQGAGTVRIATQGPLSGREAALGEGIAMGAGLALATLRGPLERLGFRVELVALEAAARRGPLTREAVAAAVRQLEHPGVTGEIEFDGKGDRRKAVSSVLQVTGEDPRRWGENRVVRQLVVVPPTRSPTRP
jgi:hypothetical protein